jgi:hypothetical protein
LRAEVGLRGRSERAVARIHALAVAAQATETRAVRAMIASCGEAAHLSWSAARFLASLGMPSVQAPSCVGLTE